MITNFNKFSVKDRRKSKWKNNGFRSLFESIIPNEVILALKDWKDHCDSKNYVIIGGIALSYYIKPRYTEDIDLVFLSYDHIPNNVFKFRRNREHSFEHIKTGVEVELLTPKHLDRNDRFFEVIFQNSKESDGIKIASPESLIALKLRRFNNTDRNDIKELYKYCIENNIQIELEKYELSELELKNYSDLILTIDDSINENFYMLNNKLKINSKYYKKYNLNDYEIYIMNEKFGEPRFHVIKNINNKIKKFNDFQFSISITKPFNESGKIRVLDSSTEYNSLDNFPNLESEISNWILNNSEIIKEDWNFLNSRKIT
jgi:predicted nucleotidyltransferase